MKTILTVFLFGQMFLLAGEEKLKNEITVHVKGMVCSFCGQGITKKFKEEKAVETIKVDLEKNTVQVLLKPEGELDDASIRRIISDAGFSVESIDRAPALFEPSKNKPSKP